MTRAQMDMTLDVMAHSLVLLGPGPRRRGAPRGGRARLRDDLRRRAPDLAVVRGRLGREGRAREPLPPARGRAVPKGIAVNAIRASVTDTPALRKIPGNAEMIGRVLAVHPARRLTTPQDVAAVIVAMAAPRRRG